MAKRRNLERRAPAASPPDGRKRSIWILLAILCVVTFAAYQPAWHGGALWDDDAHLTRPELQGPDGLYRIWFEVGATLQHYPVLHTAFWIEHKLWGDAMTGYHLVNIGMHCVAAILLVMLLRRLAVPGALFVAAIFALHPVQVESVAWITELKNTLSTVFYLAAALWYLRFDRTRRVPEYAVAAFLFLLAVLSKTVAGTLPLALLIVIWWQRGRIVWRRDVVPLAPLLALGVVAGLVTAWWEREFNRTTLPEFSLSLIERVLIAGRAIVFQVSTLAWPANLTFSYPRWHVDTAMWWQYLFPVAVAATLFAGWLARHRTRAPLAAFLFFCITLGPTLSFFNLYTFRYSYVADHYQYVACIGIFVLAVAAMIRAADRFALGSALRTAGSVALLTLLAALTWQQSHQYASSDALYAATLERNPDSWLAHLNLGTDLQRRGQLSDAIAHYRAAVAIEPDAVEIHQNLGLALQKSGLYAEAQSELRAAQRINNEIPEIHEGLGACWQSLGRLDDAATEFREAIRLRPSYAEAHLNLAATLDAQGHVEDAIGEYAQAVRFGPGIADAHFRLANALMKLGRTSDAIAEYGRAIGLDGGVAEYYNNIGFAMEQVGRSGEALEAYTTALRLQPESARIENNIGNLLIHLGRFDDAIAHLRHALQIEPDFVPAQQNLARAMAGRE